MALRVFLKPAAWLVLALSFATAALLAWWKIAYERDEHADRSERGGVPVSGQIAVWLAHRWVQDPAPAGEITALAARLRKDRVSAVYQHVGPLEEGGSLKAERWVHREPSA